MSLCRKNRSASGRAALNPAAASRGWSGVKRPARLAFRTTKLLGRREAGPAYPRCGLCRRADGSAGAFVVAELGRDPHPFIPHLYAALAEKERPLISERAKLLSP